MQKILVPRDYADLMEQYRARMTAFRQVEQDFMSAMAGVDAAVYEAFGIQEEERAYIEKRLDSFPLNRLKPRYPWQTVRPRAIKSYTTDRFA